MNPVFARLARTSRAWLPRALAVAAAGWASLGCGPHIGSSCSLSTDCSAQGDRLCDTSQPGGYCTILDCNATSCPDHAACVMFESTLPGCSPTAAYGDYAQPSRTGLSFCMQHCGDDSDCRSGYVCRNPRYPPWNAAILTPDQTWSVCIAPSHLVSEVPDAAEGEASVCSASLPPVLASMMDAAPDVASPAEAGEDAREEKSLVDAPVDSPEDQTVVDGPPADGPVADGPIADAPDEAGADAAAPDAAVDAPTGG